ncbi:hypothetical protein ACQUSR_29225 [Streptomyces sp. P1-3]|uniref:hypothetical protein n=1 Tax=Streptomyces sp. P1-3 TaxID=3421658 RepID=UPI003D364CA6
MPTVPAASEPEPEHRVSMVPSFTIFAGRRLAAVLRELHRDERIVAHERAHIGDSRRQAAPAAGPPASYGERIRRKLKRLGERHTACPQAAALLRGSAR